MCSAHLGQKKSLGLSAEEFIRHPSVKPLPGFGPCEVASCPRSRDGHCRRYCMAHCQRRLLEISKGSTLDEETWRLTTPAIAQAGVVSLLGLPDRVMAEVLYGLHASPPASGTRTNTSGPSAISCGPGRSARRPNSTSAAWEG